MLKQSLKLLFILPLFLNAQSNNFLKLGTEKGQFYGYPAVQILACQIDGDNASGYNKFGYQAEIVVGVGLNNEGATVEYTLGVSQRGSRRPSDPNDISITPFNLSMNFLDQGLYIGKHFKERNAHLKFGIRMLNLLSANDSDGYILSPEENLRKLQILGDINIVISITKNWGIKGGFQYSLSNITAQKSSQTDVWGMRGAALHNNIGLGAIYAF